MTTTTTATTSSTTELGHRLPVLAEGSRRIVLVRHGETDWNARGWVRGGGRDDDASEGGRIRAHALARELHRSLPHLDVVASSHLSRSSAVADIVSREFREDHPVRIVNHRFGEMRFGDFEGLAVTGPGCADDELRERYRSFETIMHANKDVPWPGIAGESVRQVEDRARAGISQILRGFPDCDHFCIVAHGRFNKVLLMSLLGLTGKDSIQQGNTGINVVDVDRQGEWKAHVINYLQHTERDAKTTTSFE